MFDPKCLELAEYFIPSGPELDGLRNRLAQHIQDAVEDWLTFERLRLSAGGQGAGRLQ